MNTAVINIKTNPTTKAKAQEVAAELGLSLSSVINGFLKQFVRTKKVTFSTEEPSEYLIQAIKQAEENLKKGNTSPVFTNAKDNLEWLKKQGI